MLYVKSRCDPLTPNEVEEYIDSKISRPTNRASKLVKVNTGSMDTVSVFNIILAELNSTNLCRFEFG